MTCGFHNYILCFVLLDRYIKNGCFILFIHFQQIKMTTTAICSEILQMESEKG